jgi:hypothetical protein
MPSFCYQNAGCECVLESVVCYPYVMVLRDDFPREPNRIGEAPRLVIFDHVSPALVFVDASGNGMLFSLGPGGANRWRAARPLLFSLGDLR